MACNKQQQKQPKQNKNNIRSHRPESLLKLGVKIKGHPGENLYKKYFYNHKCEGMHFRLNC